MLDVKIKRLFDTAFMPTYGSTKAACMDLYANLGFHDAMTVNGLAKKPNFIEIPPHSLQDTQTEPLLPPSRVQLSLALRRVAL